MKTDNDYHRAHQRLRKAHGKATECQALECESKNPKRFEWALRKGHCYSDDPKDYLQLCPSCHRKYDYTDAQRQKISTSHKGKALYVGGHTKWVQVGIEASKKQVNQYNKEGKLIKQWSSVSEACRALNIRNSAISNCLKGLAKTSGGYIWRLQN